MPLREYTHLPDNIGYPTMSGSPKRLEPSALNEVQRAAIGPQAHPFLPFVAGALEAVRDSFRHVPAPPPMWQTCW